MRSVGKIFLAAEDASDALVNAAVFASVYVLLVRRGGQLVYSEWIWLAVLPVLSSLVYRIFDLNLPISPSRSAYGYTPRLVTANIVFFASSGALLLMTLDFSRRIVLWAIVCAAISTVLLRIKKSLLMRALRALRGPSRALRVLLIGDNHESASSFVREVCRAEETIMLVGSVGDGLQHVGCEWLGKYRELEEVIRHSDPDYAVFAVSSYKEKSLMGLVNLCDEHCIKVYFLPVIYGFFKSARQVEYLGEIPLINVHATPLDLPSNAFLKRTLDITVALALIILTLPVMIFAAVGVWLSSDGPIIFKQRRVGRLGREFVMYKFRSMIASDSSDTAWSRGDDPRKTRFGNFLRRTSIDELPQLFNVLRGEMSLVGPRPEIPYFVEKFKDEIPLYMLKHYVKPGVTGLAQVRGLRGDTSISERIEADLRYIEEWSIFLDLKILLKTPFAAINPNEKYNNGDKK